MQVWTLVYEGVRYLTVCRALPIILRKQQQENGCCHRSDITQHKPKQAPLILYPY